MNHVPINKQSGAVLVMVLLIVAVIVGITVQASSRFQLSVARADQRLYTAQAKQYALGFEDFAMWGLKKDIKKDRRQHGSNPYDHCGEQWFTQKVNDLTLNDGVTVAANLQDAQSRFNLNLLGGRPQKYNPHGRFVERFDRHQRRFIRLLQTMPNDVVDTAQAEAIMEAVIDWIDQDNNLTGAEGAEEEYYLSQQPAYRPSNQMLVSVSELRLIKGISDDIYHYLRPRVVALPSDALINLNTALPEVMRTLNQAAIPTPLSQAQADTLMATLPNCQPASLQSPTIGGQSLGKAKQGFASVNDFFNSHGATTVFGTDQALWPEQAGLTTGSGYFLLKAKVQLLDRERQSDSLLKRDSASSNSTSNVDRVTVFRRMYSPY